MLSLKSFRTFPFSATTKIFPLRPFSSSFGTYVSAIQTQRFSKSDRLSIEIDAKEDYLISSDVLVIPFFKSKSKDFCSAIPPELSAPIKSVISQILTEDHFNGEFQKSYLTRLFQPEIGFKYLALVGLGERSEKPGSEFDALISQNFGRSLGSLSQTLNCKSMSVTFPVGSSFGNGTLNQVLMGIYDKTYKDNRFKSQSSLPHHEEIQVENTETESDSSKSLSLTFLGCPSRVVSTVAVLGPLNEMVSSGVHFAKDLVGSEINQDIS